MARKNRTQRRGGPASPPSVRCSRPVAPSGDRLPGGADRLGQERRGQPGRGDQQGFLERGAVRGLRLVEDGGDREVASAVEQAVDAQLRAGQVLLDQQRLVT
jgi:hypothetical protein